MTLTAPDQDTATGLTCDKVAAGYGGPPVIRDICVGVAVGEIAVVAGPNGAGKSTLVKAIVGHLRCSSGSITLGDRAIANQPPDKIARFGVGYVPQHQDVFDTMTVTENLEIGGYLLPRKEVPKRMDDVFAVFPKLATLRHRPVGRLSGGERKMVAVGRVLMLRPKVLVLDEPTAGLSVSLTVELFETHITTLARSGVGILLVEQKASEALRIANWGYILVSGEVHVSQSAAEILSRPDLGEVFLGGSTSLGGSSLLAGAGSAEKGEQHEQDEQDAEKEGSVP
jgi:branched-chain amino acid transport system ATP-binding protein